MYYRELSLLLVCLLTFNILMIMKKLFAFLFAASVMVVACDSDSDLNLNDGNTDNIGNVTHEDELVSDLMDGDKINFDNVTCENVDKLLELCNEEYDVDALYKSLTSCGVVLKARFRDTGNGWHDFHMPGESCYYGFALGDEVYHIYGDLLNHLGDMEKFCLEYDYSYDIASATLYTKSICHDYTYQAKVIYFKDNVVIFDGILGIGDVWNDDYADRRIVYIFTLDSDAPAEWKRLFDEWSAK